MKAASARLKIVHYPRFRMTTLDLLDWSGRVVASYSGTKAVDAAGKLTCDVARTDEYRRDVKR